MNPRFDPELFEEYLERNDEIDFLNPQVQDDWRDKVNPAGDFFQSASTLIPITDERPCPRPGGRTEQRCRTPQRCPRLRDLRCMTHILNFITFDLVQETRREPGDLIVVNRRIENRTIRLNSNAMAALVTFVGLMFSNQLPITRVLSLGSTLCRCIRKNGRNTNTLSDHASGDAIDIAGVRWMIPSLLGLTAETIVNNFDNAAHPNQQELLRRINACLRLAFPRVLDYNFNSDHHNHFHCDMNSGRGRPIGSDDRSTWLFIQEILDIPLTGELDPETRLHLSWMAGIHRKRLFTDNELLNQALDELFTSVADGTLRVPQPPEVDCESPDSEFASPTEFLRQCGGTKKTPTTPTSGKFYQIKWGDTLLKVAGQAYGVGPGKQRLKFARLINDHPFNRRFRRMVKKERHLFPDGRISFNPRFACDLNKQITAKGMAPKGNCYALLWMPPRDGKTIARRVSRRQRRMRHPTLRKPSVQVSLRQRRRPVAKRRSPRLRASGSTRRPRLHRRPRRRR